MKSKSLYAILPVLLLLACNMPLNIVVESTALSAASTPITPALSTNTESVASSATSIVSTTNNTIAAPSATLTLSPINTPAPQPGNMTVFPVSPSSADYIDDRSTPSQLIVSYFNAINRKEYARAYSYWSDPANSLGDFSSFIAGYNETTSVDLVFGQITGDRAMSQYHYAVPVILKVTLNSGARTNWTACYILHAAVPEVFGAPPFVPMDIENGSANQSDIHADDATVLATACNGQPTGGYRIPVAGSPLNIDKNNFIDNRSGPIETVSSLLNALNLKQYVRAYSYFQNPSNYPGGYDSYAAGFSDTDTITATFGTAQTQGAAGSLYYKVPLAMQVLATSKTTQTFVGCYTLRLLEPGAQVTPPFQPMGIVAGRFSKVNNSSDVKSQLPSACN